MNWLLDGLRTHVLFFPLWLGYILTVDGLVALRKGTSLATRSLSRFVGLFLLSVPVWWLFEVLNWRLANWHYLGRDQFSDLSHFLIASVNFSTVIPAVFATSELVSSFAFVRRLPDGPKLKPTVRWAVASLLTGAVMLAVTLGWPRIFFPLTWLSIYFLIAPVNYLKGYRSLWRQTAKGNWRPAVALALGVLICGFFWEMWNYYAFPKWIYEVHPFEFLYIFEMPLLGYGGYVPFALELFALYHLAAGLLGLGSSRYLQIGEA
jgi:hypothetical protein